MEKKINMVIVYRFCYLNLIGTVLVSDNELFRVAILFTHFSLPAVMLVNATGDWWPYYPKNKDKLEYRFLGNIINADSDEDIRLLFAILRLTEFQGTRVNQEWLFYRSKWRQRGHKTRLLQIKWYKCEIYLPVLAALSRTSNVVYISYGREHEFRLDNRNGF